MFPRATLFILTVVFLSGCAKLAHLQELLTLKAYSDNKDAQAQYVEDQDAKFAKLVEVIRQERLSNYTTQKVIRAEFGEPVYTKRVDRKGSTYEVWLYRYATKYFNTEKVYFYFDEKGVVQDWEYQIPQPKPSERKNNFAETS